MGRHLFAGGEAIFWMSVLAACSAGSGEATSDSTDESVSTCGLSVTENVYDGPNYWGTITVKNGAPSAAKGLTVHFEVPSGAACTQDAVPSGAVLATSSNACTFTWATRTLAAGASFTFNYSTDSTSFHAASSVTASAASCGGSGGADAGTDAGTVPVPVPAPDAGPASIGCNGAAGCAVWTKVYQTWYGFNDNSCGTENVHSCNDIAYPGYGPKKHQVATEGKGTYDDPVTAAAADNGCESAGGATLQPGTLIYNPEVHKYFIMEDSCLECTQECNCQSGADGNPPGGCKKDEFLHIDFWMGPNDQAQNATQLNACEDDLTLGNPYAGPGEVIVNPPANLPVDTTPLFVNGQCTAKTYPDPP
jgi:hypothetical protein